MKTSAELKQKIHLIMFNQFSFFFIFLFFVPFYSGQQALSSFKYFQRLKLSAGNILLPNENGINIIGNEFNFIVNLEYSDFENEGTKSTISILSQQDLEYFSIRQFDYSDNSGNYILLNVAEQYYLLDGTGENIQSGFL